MELAKKSLKVYSYFVIFAGIVFLGVGIYALVNYPAVASYFQTLDTGNSLEPRTATVIACIIVSLFCFLLVYLLRTAIKSGKKTTLLIVLLALGLVVTLASLVKAFSVASLLGLAINGFILYQVFVLRKAAK